MAKSPEPGQPAPDFEARLASGEAVRLSDFRGKYLVLYFYPKAFTPGCTSQVCSFRDNHDQIVALGAEVLGVSPDPAQRVASFADRYSANFGLIADPDGDLCKLYGVARPLIGLVRRKTFVIDPDGRVGAVFHHELRVDQHQDDVLAYLQAARGND